MPVDKIKPFHDPRVSLRSANLNGRTHGYIFMPRSTKADPRGTVFLIHGFPDLSFGWRYQIPFLSSLGLDVIALDCMGYGRSDSPNPLAEYTFKRISSDIATLCTQLSLSSIILGGHDWGGAIIYRVAQYQPKLIHALFSICTPYPSPSPVYLTLQQLVTTRLPNFGYQLHFASGQIEEYCSTPGTIRQFLCNLYGARTPDTNKPAFSVETGVDLTLQSTLPATNTTGTGTSSSSSSNNTTNKPKKLLKLLDDDELDFYVQEYSRHGLRGPLNWYRTRELNYDDELEYFFDGNPNPKAVGKTSVQKLTIRQPTLFVLATKDQALKPEMAEKMEARFPSFTRREIAAGHWALWEKPEEVNRMIGEWLEKEVFMTRKPGLDSKL